MRYVKPFFQLYIRWLERGVDPITRYEGSLKALLLELKGSDRWLDLGSGNGYFTRVAFDQAVEKPQRVVCLDHASAELAGAKSYGFEAICGDVHSMPAKDEAFTKVSAFQVLEHVPEPATLLKEVYRVCAQGGLVLLVTPNAEVWRKDNLAFAPLLRSRLLKRLSTTFLACLFKGSHIPQGIDGYDSWKKEVSHVRDGFTVEECRRLGEEAGFQVVRAGTLGSSRLYYYYLDAFNFSFPSYWKVVLGPLLPLLAAIERRFDDPNKRRARWLIFKHHPGVNTYVLLRKGPPLCPTL